MCTWKTVESADFVEHASYLVCDDLHHNLGVVQSNFREICNITASWSDNGQLDVFSPRDSGKSFSMEQLQDQHRFVKRKFLLPLVTEMLVQHFVEETRRLVLILSINGLNFIG